MSIRRRYWTNAKGEQKEAWIADYVDQHGKRHIKTFKSQKAANEWLPHTQVAVQQNTFTPESTSATLAQALDLWQERAAADGRERSTLNQYRQHADHILVALDGRQKLARLSRAQCEAVRDALLRQHSRELARKVLVSFRSALRDARRRGLMAANPAAETTIGRDDRHKEKLKEGRDFPTVEQFRSLLDQAGPKAKAALSLAGNAGMHASELRGLPWSNVDLIGRKVTIEQRADKWAQIGSPKSASSRRTIDLSDETVQALKEWKLAQPAGRTLVLGTASDRPDLLANLTNRVLAPLCESSGVPSYGWHGFRHLCISRWLKTCRGDFKAVQHAAGHSTLALTLDTYGHLLSDGNGHAMIAAAEAL